jgi:hypothetical protein
VRTVADGQLGGGSDGRGIGHGEGRRTSNIQHRTSNIQSIAVARGR